jgi:hypothetical protein
MRGFLQRQVGFDESGRPVIYSCFAQASNSRNTVEDSVTHSTYLIENAKKTMPLGVSTWVFIMDCSGNWDLSILAWRRFKYKYMYNWCTVHCDNNLSL